VSSVKELIEYLKTVPLDAELRVLTAYDCGYSTCVKFVPLEIEGIKSNIDYTDLSGNPHIKKDSPIFDKRFLDFGEE